MKNSYEDKILKNNAGLYIDADPFTYSDMDLIRKAIKMFGFVNILLDRKSRDKALTEKYVLSYRGRNDIVRHDLEEAKITEYRIIPIDTTLERTLLNNNIDILLLDFDYQQNTNFRTTKFIFQKANPNITISFLKSNNYAEPNFIKTLVDSDSSVCYYKDYCSEYSFTKLKIKMTKTIGITGKIGTDYKQSTEIFETHDFTVIDIDKYLRELKYEVKFLKALQNELIKNNIKYEIKDRDSLLLKCIKDTKVNQVYQRFLYSHVCNLLVKTMTKTFNNKLVVVFSMMCEFGMEAMFNRTICIDQKSEDCNTRLLKQGYPLELVAGIESVQMENEEKKEICNFTIREEDNIRHTTSKLYNSKLRKFYQDDKFYFEDNEIYIN